MPWTYGGVRIYAQKSDENTSQIIPRLQPVGGNTILQVFGNDSLVRQITALVVGDANKNSLRAFSHDDGTPHALVSPEGSLGDFILRGFVARRTDITCQTIDITQDEDAPVYDVDMELYVDE